MTFQVVNPQSGQVVSSHRSEAAAWAAVDRIQRRVSRSLNKPGMFGGVNAAEFCPLVVVPAGGG